MHVAFDREGHRVVAKFSVLILLGTHILSFDSTKVGVVNVVDTIEAVGNHHQFLSRSHRGSRRGSSLLCAVPLPIDDGILDEGLQDRQESITVLSQNKQSSLQVARKDPVRPSGTKSVDKVLGQAKRNKLWFG